MRFSVPERSFNFPRLTSIVLLLGLFVGPLAAQQPPPVQRAAQTAARAEVPPPFEDLLSADSYKVYGEVRNVGQLLSNGGAAEIVDPIIKLTDPGPQFKSVVSFLKKNSEALAQSRLMFASWAVRSDVPVMFVAIEFPTNEDAAKFAPKLETFLPTLLPPPPVTPQPSPENQKPSETVMPAPTPTPKTASGEEPGIQASLTVTGHPAVNHTSIPIASPEERLPFVITHAGNLVCITEKDFKFSKLRPKGSKALFQDQNFRIARDQFSSEPIFVFFNVALEEKATAKPSPSPVVIEEIETAPSRTSTPETTPEDPLPPVTQPALVVVAPSPTPAPTKQAQAQQIASNQIGHMLDAFGYGDPQWPEAVGLAIALDGNEYILRAMMIDKPEAKKTPIPFIPQLIGGTPFTSDAASVLPEDTDVLISASIDLTKTYEGMRKEADARAKVALDHLHAMPPGQGVAAPAIDAVDAFNEFEKKAGFKIKDDLLPAFGKEIAIAGSLKTLQGAAGLNLGIPVPNTPSEPDSDKTDQGKKKESVMPILLIEVRDRDAARKLMPGVLNGLGIGEANLIAQVEKRDDTEMVNYAGMFAYAFVGDFLVLSDANGVHKLVDAYVNHQTLSSNTVFRNSRRWQSTRTVGQIYISPALMQGYQDGLRKTSATMDAGLRDFLLGLNPNAEAITYALSDDGLGTRHELHLPKNLILMTIAGISSATKPSAETNEAVASGLLQYVVSVEEQYKQGPGKGSYGSFQQLIDMKMLMPDQFDKYGYKFELSATGDRFEAVATPKEYGKTGKRSFFVDKSGVVRGDDHGGGPATIADRPVQE